MNSNMMWYGVTSVFTFFFLIALKASGLFLWSWMFVLSPLWIFWIIMSVYVIYKVVKDSWSGK